MRQLTLARKLAAATGLIVVLVGGGGTVVLENALAASAASSQATRAAELSLAIQTMDSAYQRWTNTIDAAALAGTTTGQSGTRAAETDARTAAMAALAQVSSSLTANQRTAVTQAVDALATAAAGLQRAARTTNVAARAGALRDLDHVATQADAVLEPLVQSARARASSALASARSAAERATEWTIASLVLMVVLVSLAAVGIRRLMLAPLGVLVRSLERLSELGGKFEPLDESRHDEFGEVARAVNRFGERLVGLVERVTTSVSTISQTAHELGRTADEIQDGATLTLESATHTDVKARDVAEQIHTVSVAAEQMRIAIAEIARAAAGAVNVAAAALDEAASVKERIAVLEEATAAISSVTETIATISAQTNLLALNAAIEAARAGESGKGFAVVANEVKNLAGTTSRATDEIGAKLEAIRSEAVNAVAAMGHITEIMAQINDLESAIASAVEEQSVTTDEIVRVVGIATDGTNEIVSLVASMTTAASATSAALEQASTGLRALLAVADNLDGALDKDERDLAVPESTPMSDVPAPRYLRSVVA